MPKKPSPFAAGLALGIFFGLVVFFMTILAWGIGYGKMFADFINSIYPGYYIGLGGSVIGLVYGFIDGFIAAFIVVWLYNRFVK